MDCLKRGAWLSALGWLWPVVAVAAPESPASLADLPWHSDYAEAMRVAQTGEKMLFVYFRGTQANALRQEFECRSLADEGVRQRLKQCVLVQLPLDAEITSEGKPARLLSHRAFLELEGQEGVALIDFAHRGTDYYGYVVSALPLVQGRYYKFRPEHLAVVLDLPPGTLTQRTMVFAVRIHPEAPESTTGQPDRTLLAEAESHSGYQAQIHLQGHHHWDARYQRISSRLPDGLRAQEVVAESWPHEGLLDAACDCVHSWRQSSGHWSAVRARQPRFGYDMRRGANGIWYATGLFGNRH